MDKVLETFKLKDFMLLSLTRPQRRDEERKRKMEKGGGRLQKAVTLSFLSSHSIYVILKFIFSFGQLS